MYEAWRLFVSVPIDGALRRDLRVAVDQGVAALRLGPAAHV